MEQVSDEDASLAIGRLIFKLEEDLREMSEIIKIIDERHILYRTRAVQRAQFLLLSDGTVKSKINRILRYCAATISSPDDLYDVDDEILAPLFQMYPQGYFDANSLKPPIQPRVPTPIEELPELGEVDAEAVSARQNQLLQYATEAAGGRYGSGTCGSAPTDAGYRENYWPPHLLILHGENLRY